VTEIFEALRSAGADNPAANISFIKSLIVDNLRTADATVHVEVTDHFNHSFVPDMVLAWPGVPEKRQLFLRTGFDLPDLMADVDLLAKEKPILLPLSGVQDIDVGSEMPDVLSSHSTQHSTLITDPAGLQAFAERRTERPVVSLFSHALLQGGRGVLSLERAQQVSGVVGEGFDGAQHADFAATSTAVEATEALLDPPRASQMNRLLHAVWVGSGAPGTSFPGASGVTAVLDAEALRFVLGLDIPDDEFWRRLGQGLTTGRLCELGDAPPSDNFQRLLMGNAHRLQAKACRVSGPVRTADAPRWSVAANTLVLDLEQARVQFAPRRVSDLPGNGPTDVVPPSVSDLAARAARAEVEVEEVRLSNGESTLSYASEGGLDVAQDTALSEVANVLPGAAVTVAVARVGTAGRTVRCNFNTLTATGNSSAKFYVAELAAIAVPLLVSLTEEEQTVVRAHVSSDVQAGDHQLTDGSTPVPDSEELDADE
jgi:hypothetical protein